MSNELIELPEGWELVSIKDVTLPYITAQPTKEPEKEFQYIDIGSIDNSSQTIAEPKFFLGKDAPSRARRVVKTNDVLFSTVRTYLKNIARVPTELDGVLTSTGIAVLRAASGLNSNFLFHWVTSDAFISRISSTMDGTLYPAVTDSDVANAQIPFPPLNEQNRIVAKIEELRDRLHRSKQALEAVPQLCDRFRQSVLAAAFRGDLTADWRESFTTGNSWVEITLASVVESLNQGWSPKCENEPSSSVQVWGVIKTTAIQAMQFLEQENKQLPDTLLPRPELEIKVGDLLITRAGPRLRAGVCCLVRSVRPRLMICDKVYRFRINEIKAKPEFIELLLNSPEMIERIDALKTGISESGVNLTQQKFLNLKFLLPSLAEQEEILRRTTQLLSFIDRTVQAVKTSQGNADRLFESILSKAFQGELVEQDPNDEPASVLLERIRAERSQSQPNKKSAGTRGKRKTALKD